MWKDPCTTALCAISPAEGGIPTDCCEAWGPHGWVGITHMSYPHRSRLARGLGLLPAAGIDSPGHPEGSHLPPPGQRNVCTSLYLKRLQADRGMCAWKAGDRWRSLMLLQLVAQGL